MIIPVFSYAFANLFTPETLAYVSLMIEIKRLSMTIIIIRVLIKKPAQTNENATEFSLMLSNPSKSPKIKR